MKKLSSYQKLKKENDELYKLYHRVRKELHNLGKGIHGDDIIMEFDCKLPNMENRNEK